MKLFNPFIRNYHKACDQLNKTTKEIAEFSLGYDNETVKNEINNLERYAKDDREMSYLIGVETGIVYLMIFSGIMSAIRKHKKK